MAEIMIAAALAAYCGWVAVKKIKDLKAGKCGCGCGDCQGCICEKADKKGN